MVCSRETRVFRASLEALVAGHEGGCLVCCARPKVPHSEIICQAFKMQTYTYIHTHTQTQRDTQTYIGVHSDLSLF